MNWLEAEASMFTTPPGRSGRPVTRKGSPPLSDSTVAPSAVSAWSSGPIGRESACSSPTKSTGPSASAARGGTNRITVPASPQSMVPPPVNRAGGSTRHGRRPR